MVELNQTENAWEEFVYTIQEVRLSVGLLIHF